MGATTPARDDATEAMLADARRGFARAPVLFHLRAAAGPASSAVAAAVRRWARGAGHVVASIPPPPPDQSPGSWYPTVELHIATPRPAAIEVFDAAAGASGVSRVARPADVGAACAAFADAARTRAATAIATEARTPPTPLVTISVVVCTYRRSVALAAALRSLAAQTLSPDAWEVLVVDNDPADLAVRETIAALRSQKSFQPPDRLRLIQCAAPGLSAARNAGIARARGAIVGFLDDDAVARPDWLARLAATFAARPDAGVVGGRIVLEPPDPRPRWALPLWGRYWSEHATSFEQARDAHDWWDYPFGANWSARRPSLVAIGGFRLAYGRTGRGAAGGEEIVAAALVQRLGQAVVVDPAIEVVHRPSGDRFTLGHVWRRIRAAKREEWQQEQEGYIPATMTPAAVARRALARLRLAASRHATPPALRLEHAMHALAEVRMLPTVLRTRHTR